jgi:hypothetical protein
MIDDLFSHKIHASRDLEVWKCNLVKLAQFFLIFDNKPFDRDEFDKLLKILSPTTARSPFRDIYSIYISILGVGYITLDNGVWTSHLSETARSYLVGLEPNVEAFCRLQLTLYQKPDARGQIYTGHSIALEYQSQNYRLSLIRQGYRSSPLRLILKIFEAKSKVLGIPQDNINVTPEEIYTLVNCEQLNNIGNPTIDEVENAFKCYQLNQLKIVNGEKRFSFLEATGLVRVDRQNNLTLYPYNDPILNNNRDCQITEIKLVNNFFDEFNQCSTEDEIKNIFASRNWFNYFDACKTLSSDQVQKIAGDKLPNQSLILPNNQTTIVIPVVDNILQLPQRREINKQTTSSNNVNSYRKKDPEETRILREKRNAWHNFLVYRMRDSLIKAGLTPHETDLIDLLVDLDNSNINEIYPNGVPVSDTYIDGISLPYFNSKITSDLTFIFEIKSSDDSIVVDQVRKATSQLYEYRYRYYKENQIQQNAILVLVLQSHLESYIWLKDYLLFDRHIAVCWLKENEDTYEFDCFDECRSILEPLISG